MSYPTEHPRRRRTDRRRPIPELLELAELLENLAERTAAGPSGHPIEAKGLRRAAVIAEGAAWLGTVPPTHYPASRLAAGPPTPGRAWAADVAHEQHTPELTGPVPGCARCAELVAPPVPPGVDADELAHGPWLGHTPWATTEGWARVAHPAGGGRP
jgi:hypothetical protein